MFNRYLKWIGNFERWKVWSIARSKNLSEQNLPIDQLKALFIRWWKHRRLYSKCNIVISVTMQWMSHVTQWLGDLSQELSSWIKPKLFSCKMELLYMLLYGYSSCCVRRSRGISCCFSTEWPPRSPDLTPCDVCQWGYLKSKVYQGIVQDLAALKNNV